MTSLPRLGAIDLNQLRNDLTQATTEALDRGLNQSAKWSAELLNSIDPASPTASTSAAAAETVSSFPNPAPPISAPSSSNFHAAHFRTSTPIRHAPRESLPGLPPISSINHLVRGQTARDSLGSVLEVGSSPAGHGQGMLDVEEEAEEDTMEHDDEDDTDRVRNSNSRDATAQQDSLKRADRLEDEREKNLYLLGMTYMRLHEYLRAAHVLRDCCGPKARWLRVYSKYLAGDKRAQEEAGQLLGPKDKNIPNPYAEELLAEMETWPSGEIERDGWLLYVKAILLLSLTPSAHSTAPASGSTPSAGHVTPRLAAMDCLVASVSLEPLNWSAWLKLAHCLETSRELEATVKFLPEGIARQFFYVHATLELHAAGETLHKILDELEKNIPGCALISGLRALVFYHVRDFDEATALFTKSRDLDPYRVEDVDIFSNILYVTEKRAELAALAQQFTKIERARPEICCLVGNYYSLRREHEKAIQYFHKALKLDRNYLSAWTLMGHEYVEIKNTNAAIASYRRAVDVNRKDYRAWYGLGQTYELLGEPFYALNYYQKAAALRPYDARMWCALAICFEKLKRIPDAIKAYQRALVASEPGENDTAVRIGRLYSAQGNSFAAAQYHRKALQDAIKSDAPKNVLSKIYLWLARYEMQREREKTEEGDLAAVENFLKLAGMSQEDKEEAEGLEKELNFLLLSRT